MGFDQQAFAEQRVRNMVRGRGVELDPKPFFRLNTSLTTTPQFIAYAMLPRNVAEA
jgi:hypothetical protein